MKAPRFSDKVREVLGAVQCPSAAWIAASLRVLCSHCGFTYVQRGMAGAVVGAVLRLVPGGAGMSWVCCQRRTTHSKWAAGSWFARVCFSLMFQRGCKRSRHVFRPLPTKLRITSVSFLLNLDLMVAM